ncbi:MAG TPA: hypothetical protein VLX32_01945 [Candidatus Acidoferrum sp.]|nr:hypothetical protein [Candidatus Acidoferrum sp.]
MNCDEFENLGLDLNQSGADAEQRAAALDHLRHCSHCAGLVESWEEARAELFLLGDATREAQTPLRVEMRLRQEFRAQRRPSVFYRRTALVAAWSLAVVTLVAGAWNWESWRHQQPKKPAITPVATNGTQQVAAPNDVLLADSDTSAFIPLPGTIPIESGDASVMQVRMQRGALSALGLPVDQEHVSDWIRVDLLVAEDGVPQAVRLHQATTQEGTSQ